MLCSLRWLYTSNVASSQGAMKAAKARSTAFCGATLLVAGANWVSALGTNDWNVPAWHPGLAQSFSIFFMSHHVTCQILTGSLIRKSAMTHLPPLLSAWSIWRYFLVQRPWPSESSPSIEKQHPWMSCSFADQNVTFILDTLCGSLPSHKGPGGCH